MRAKAEPLWTPPPLIQSKGLRWFLRIAIVAYLILAVSTLDIDLERLVKGMDRAREFLSAFFSPDFQSRWRDIREGMLESLYMTVVSTILGVVLALPLGLAAARNFAPLPVYLTARAFIAISRTFPEVIIAIFFVVAIGFGPLAGTLTLAFASLGFMGKLLAEKIEETDPEPIEGIRATGASSLQTVVFGLFPDILPRWIGLSLYRLDINFRESAIIGVVGAGGIGATLNTAFDRYDYDSAAAILILIIVLVLITENVSSKIRRRFL